MPINFSGIREKLERAKKNIHNLQVEIGAFFESGKYPVLPKDDKQLLLDAIAYHKKRPIPLRFSVLAGEVIHHLRSCFDHIAWEFSSGTYRELHPKRIEFPVLEVMPVLKNGGTGYERQVKGIRSPAALILIEMLQPYYAPDPIDSPLLIIHKFDIIDKHRELVLCAATGAFQLPMEVLARYVDWRMSSDPGKPKDPPVNLGLEFERHGKIIPNISFNNFGSREIKPVIEGLVELYNFTVQIVGKFDGLSGFD